MKLIQYFIIILFTFFGISKLGAQSFEISPVIMNFDAEPGQTQTKSITITNHASKRGAFSIALGDFVINKEGNKIGMTAGSTEHSLVNWISINPPFVELEPNETKQIVVSTQSPVGDYSTRWANILVRSTSEQTASIADKAVQTGLVVQGQIIIRAYQSPKSNTNFKMKITGLVETSPINDSIRVFKAIVDNLGDKITNCKVTLLASDLTTTAETKLTEIKFGSFPDSQREIKLKINKKALPPGRYALAAILDYGSQSNLEGTQILINVE